MRDHPNVKFQKTSRFAKCTKCHDLKAAIEKAGCNKNIAVVNEARQKLYDHREDICAERRHLYFVWDRCKDPNYDMVGIMLDGATNADGNFPHTKQKTKLMDSHMNRLETRLTGGIIQLPKVQVRDLLSIPLCSNYGSPNIYL
jgi:hypothetical protein